MGLRLLLCLAVCVFPIFLPPRPEPRRGTIIIYDTPGKPANVLDPAAALGAGVDGHENGATARVYTAPNIRAMRSAGLTSLTYRLRTELAVEAWHWNPRGTWSDTGRHQGYWTSDATPGAPIRVSYGYRLPRRGSTFDQANDDGYSRIDDGDPATFWKSNPYLDRTFTGEDNAKHPQWVVIDLGRDALVNAARIRWGEPYAEAYRMEYWDGPPVKDLDKDAEPEGAWRTFPGGRVTKGAGGDTRLTLCPEPRRMRFVRILMMRGSGTSDHTSDHNTDDVRDRLGFAIREISLGTNRPDGSLNDVVRHAPSNKRQTIVYVSSTDPWHRETDRDPNVEQPGLDLVFQSGLGNGRPVMVPVGLLYDTPDNAAAEIRYLRARGYPVTHVEMGEEPDGQYVAGADYGALYLLFADALHAVDPALKLGGPSMQTVEDELRVWPEQPGQPGWFESLLRYLKARRSLREFAFFSFEWYPFDDVCAAPSRQLTQAPELLRRSLERLVRQGLPQSIPWVMAEYGYSAYAGQAEMDLAGGLLNADIVGSFLTQGGAAAYLYGYEPNVPIREVAKCNTWGNLALFLSDDRRVIRAPLATCHAARLYAREWLQPDGGRHEVYRAATDIRDGEGRALVTAYAVKRPDGRWAVMAVNKDPARAWTVDLRFAGGHSPAGPLEVYQFSARQYRWKADGPHGRPLRSLPPARYEVAGPSPVVTLPPFSLTVLRTRPDVH